MKNLLVALDTLNSELDTLNSEIEKNFTSQQRYSDRKS